MDKEPMKISKQEAKSDAKLLVHKAISVLKDNNWKTRQDQRAANKVYTYLLAAEKALEIAESKEDEDIEMVPVNEDDLPTGPGPSGN